MTGFSGPAEGSPHCHVPAELDPEHSASRGAAVEEIHRLLVPVQSPLFARRQSA